MFSRYCSVNIHKKQDVSRRDDIWSLIYSIVEMVQGRLPWRGGDPFVFMIKKSFNENISSKLPHEFASVTNHLSELNFETKPDYNLVRGVFHDVLRRKDIEETDPFDWELQSQPFYDSGCDTSDTYTI